MLIGGVASVRPMLYCVLFICVPLACGTWLVARTLPDAAGRTRLLRIVLWGLFAFYLAALCAVLFIGRIDLAQYAKERAFYLQNKELVTNFIPFETIRLYIRCLIYGYIGVGIPFDNLMGNVLLFMPMAFLLPCLFPSMRRFWRFFALMLAVLVAVEALQFVLCCGSCDVDDVLLNLAGTLLVYGLLRIPAIDRLLRRLYLLREAERPVMAGLTQTADAAVTLSPASATAESGGGSQPDGVAG